MDQRLSLITLGVANLTKARKFYVDGLGWKASAASDDAIVFIQLGGIGLSLFQHDALAEDAGVTPGGASGFRGVTVAQNVPTKGDVDAALKLAAKAGGCVVRAAADTSWGGYAGYFADPDGHLWEVAWSPHFKLGPDGELILPPPK